MIQIAQSNHKLSKSELNHTNNTYLSEKIPIRFQDCTHALNEICIFKTTVDAAGVGYKNTPLIVLAEVLLVEGDKITTVIEYEAVTGTLFEHGYLPMLFDNLEGRYTCSLEIELHSQLLGFKFVDNSSTIK